MKRWFAAGSMILVILAAVYMLSQSMRGNSEVYQGIAGKCLAASCCFWPEDTAWRQP